MAATVRRKQFPLLCHCVRRIPRGTNSFRLPALHCVATASGAARPSPAGRITTRTRWARTLFHQKEFHHGQQDRKSTRLNSSHSQISYAVFCLKKKKKQ